VGFAQKQAPLKVMLLSELHTGWCAALKNNARAEGCHYFTLNGDDFTVVNIEFSVSPRLPQGRWSHLNRAGRANEGSCL